MPFEKISECIGDFAIAQVRAGYTDSWYDALDMDNKFHSYYFKVPEKKAEFYISVETYSSELVPEKCHESDNPE